ncbi:hypothetical protein DMB42_34715 [Nonomuraea sp. WAC 01424]|nr:hypothetical protein DMB42_34715 [Nonomuraea sp. WAC 01424]
MAIGPVGRRLILCDTGRHIQHDQPHTSPSSATETMTWITTALLRILGRIALIRSPDSPNSATIVAALFIPDIGPGMALQVRRSP